MPATDPLVSTGNYINMQDLQQNILSQSCVPVNEGFLTETKKNPQRPVSAGADSSSARGKRALLHARAAPEAFRNH
jgi:hypothetical protein